MVSSTHAFYFPLWLSRIPRNYRCLRTEAYVRQHLFKALRCDCGIAFYANFGCLFAFGDATSTPYVEVQGYLKLNSLYEALRHIFAIVFSVIMCLFSAGRVLMEKYPSFLSAGLFSKEGPSRQQIMESSTKVTFHADGWKKNVADSEKQLAKPDKKIKLTITGPEAGYALTTMCMVQAALTVLQDSDRMPFKGGVYTPGVAFENTRLQERLEERGMTFTYEEIL
ncbi:Saccharopine dehydrogenase-like oxidoreductase [Araneus ventricosus]|uniref:Saccharopine dehydrogenase-like oxidoreductase n=1 Tax=Araneus ventricosus TaxID=182803 RepID=A0A4Y2SPW6_ARAVE|nr:Saccharopine dehydrogenase-like oxidoreductase [Araneus ventricosus]